MQGSCRPWITSSVSAPADRLTVRWGRAMDGVGFMAVRRTRGMPLVMPPRMPPAWLVSVTTRPSSMRKESLFADPQDRAAANPSPNSTPFTAGMPKRAAESRFSTPPNMGPPSPAGRPTAAHSMTPPRESPPCFAARMAACIRSPARSSSTGKGLAAIPSNRAFVGCRGNAASVSVPTERRWAPTYTPRRARICLAMPPAMHSGAVSRPEKWPPPRMSAWPPHLTKAV